MKHKTFYSFIHSIRLRSVLLLAVMFALAGTAAADNYSRSYDYAALKNLMPQGGSWADADTYLKVPQNDGDDVSFTIPIESEKQPTSNITLTFSIATFGSGTNPSSSNTTITAVGTEESSNWNGSGVSTYPSSKTYVNGVMTITKPDNPTTLGGLTITMGVNSDVKIFRLQSLTVAYTYDGGGTPPAPTTYTVTYDCNGATSGCPNDETGITAGTSITLAAAPTKTDYTFDGWNDGTNTYQAGSSYTVNDNVTMTAQWTANSGSGGDSSETLTFDFEDDGAHRPNTSNSYTGTNTYTENGIDITLTYADAVTTGTPLNGSANVIGRVGKNTTNSPVILIGPIDISAWTITEIEYKTKGVGAMSQLFETSLNGSDWTTQLNINSMPTSNTTETVDNLSIAGSNLYLRWTVSVSSSTGANRDFQLDDVVITYTQSSNPVPTITASNVGIAYNSTSGNIAFTVNNGVTGGVLTAAVTDGNEGNWLTLGTVGTDVPFTCTANEANTERTATVTLTYTYGDNQRATKDVTITQAAAPVIYTTIPDLLTAATSTSTPVNVTFGNWVVTGVNGGQVFVTDGTNGFIIYQSGHGFAVGNTLSGTVSCNLVLFNGSVELTGLTASTEGLTVGTGGSVTPVITTIDALGAVNTGSVVTLNNLTYDGSVLSDGTNTINFYTTLYNGTLVSGKTYNVTGVFVLNNTTKRILPRSAEDIEEVAVTTPYINIDSDEFELTAGEEEGYLEIAYGNLTINSASDFSVQFFDEHGDALTSSSEPDWIDAEVTTQTGEAGYFVYYYVVPNNGAARTAYFKVRSGSTYSNLVTVTQVAYVAPPTPVSGKYVKVTSTDDITDGGQYLIVCEDANVALNGDLETLDAISNTIGVTISSNEIVATSATVAAEFTIAVIDGGYSVCSAKGEYIYHTGTKNTLNTSDEAHANSISFDEGNVLITVGLYNLKYNANSGQTRFRYFTTDQTAIQLYKKVESVTVTPAGYATYCSENALDFTGTAITAYVGTINGTALTFTPITQVPANTGLLLVAEGGATVDVPVIVSADPVQNNCLTGVNEATTLKENDYILNVVGGKAGFYKAGEYKALAAHRAYISATAGGQVKSFYIDLEDDPTGISLTPALSEGEGAIYNLAGQRLNKMQKGINIVNGKKILK